MADGWIWLPEGESRTARVALFRCVQDWEAVPETFRVRVTADSRYKLYVNGEPLAEGPCKGNREERYHEVLDAAPLMKPGRNVWAAAVLGYPAEGGNQSVLRTGTPRFFLAPEDGGTVWTGSWRGIFAEGVRFLPENPWYAPLGFYEDTVGDKALRGWMTPEYDDSRWLEPVPAPPMETVERPIPLLRGDWGRFSEVTRVREGDVSKEEWNALLREDRPVTVRAGRRAVVELSAEVLRTAFLRLRMTGGGGASLTLLQSECYVEGLPERSGYRVLPRKGDRADASGELTGYEDRYTVAGGGTEGCPEEYEPFWFRTFRYVRLTVETGEEPITIRELRFRETGYPLEVRSRVETSDRTLQDIWDISLRSLRLCMHETYEDCPFYEQLQYLMDARSEMLYTYAVAADDRLARRCLEDFRASARPEGLLDARAPSTSPNVIPGFSVYYLGMLHDHRMYFGDRTLAERHLDTALGVLEFFHRNLNASGLVGRLGGFNGKERYWSFIDWAPGWETGVPGAIRQGPLTMESLLYLLGLQWGEELCRWLERSQEAETLRLRAEALREALRTRCMDGDGLLRDGPEVPLYSQHCQVFAVLTGTVDVSKGRESLLRTLREPERFTPCSVAMALYLFRALEACGLYDRTAALWDPWRRMVTNRLSTCSENDGQSRSDCHAWGALALYELPASILGVRPASPGFETFSVHPLPCGLDWAEGEVAMPRGVVHVQWHSENGSPKVKFSPAFFKRRRGPGAEPPTFLDTTRR